MSAHFDTRWSAPLLGIAAILLASAMWLRAGGTSPAPLRHTVGAIPDAPGVTPSGGWELVYGDAFGAPFGTGRGQDDTLYPNAGGAESRAGCADNPGFGHDEMEVFNCSQAVLDGAGLHLSCSWSPNRWRAGSGPHGATGTPQVNYVCGAVQSTEISPPGYRFFAWQPRHGQTWAFQCVCRLPPNTGAADPGWWSSDDRWTQELDFLEGWGLTGASWSDAHVTTPTWVYTTHPLATQDNAGVLAANPASAYHTYTTVVLPNNSYEEFIDGRLQRQYGDHGVIGPAPAGPSPHMGLRLSYALRAERGDPNRAFRSGANSFDIGSISVYENRAARRAATVGSGVAPGTVVSTG